MNVANSMSAYISRRFWSATIFLFVRLLSRQIFFSARWSLLLIWETMCQKHTRFKVTLFIPFTSWVRLNISQYVSFFTMKDVTPLFWILISKNASCWKRFYKYEGYLKGKKQIRNKGEVEKVKMKRKNESRDEKNPKVEGNLWGS
jgi:hypothetical protein